MVVGMAIVCARYLGTFVELGPAGTRAAAVAAILLLSARGARTLSRPRRDHDRVP
jgi:hypothetical protein